MKDAAETRNNIIKTVMSAAIKSTNAAGSPFRPLTLNPFRTKQAVN
jgi:hypothetical protein